MRIKLTAVLLFILSFFMLNYKLGNGSLEPWDEAWYADVARSITRGDIIIPKYNSDYFIDHPPLGFWTEALSFKVFGESSHSARLPSAVFASLTVSTIFLLGTSISNYYTGIMAALILFTSRWFLLRSRGGDLEPLLMLLQTTSVYLSWNAKNIKQLAISWLILGLSLLTKTFVSLSLIPILIYNTYTFSQNHRLSSRNIVSLTLLFMFIPVLWYLLTIQVLGIETVKQNIIQVAFRGGEMQGLNINNVQNILLLVRSVIHRWYQPLLLSAVLTPILFFKKTTTKKILVYLTCMLLPYIISAKTRSWHIIPVIVPMALLISHFLSELARYFGQYGKLVNKVFLVFVLVVAGWSFSEYRSEAYSKTDSISDQERIGQSIKYLNGPIYLDAFHNQEPSMIYYADRKVIVLSDIKSFNPTLIARPYILVSENIMSLTNCSLIVATGNTFTHHCQ